MNVLRFVAPILVGALLVACGADDDHSSGGGGGGASSDPGAAAKNYFVTVFGVMSGTKQPQTLIDIYAPECRANLKASDIASFVGFIRLFMPDISKLKIEDVDLGKLKIETKGDEVTVTPSDVNAVRVKVDGKFHNANTYFTDIGFDEGSSDGPISTNEGMRFVRRDGKLYVADCSDLQDFGSMGDLSPSGSPTAVPTGPGSSRTNGFPMGQAGTVEKTWQITVASVNRDAASAVLTANRFNATPTPNERFVLISLRAKNVAAAQKAENISDFDFKLTGSRNELYSSYNDKSSCGTVPNEISADLFPGGQTEGNVCFKVPRDETNLVLVWDSFMGSSSYFKIE